MAICKFWQQGNCRNGDRCRFEHPGSGGNANNNRFSALQGPDASSSRNGNSYQNGASSNQSNPYNLDKASIIADLSSEKPQWILSAYGPGKQPPIQLFGGPLREQSFEEMRLKHYTGIASGNPQAVVQEADKLYQAAEQQIQAALGNVEGAIDFITRAGNEHPNRRDECSLPQSSSHSQPTPTPAAGAFGAPSQPALGAPSVPSGAFGQPSALGQRSNPFGAPAQTSAFGAPSQLGSGGAFGQPSALGQRQSPFGAPSGPVAAPVSAFGQPSGSFSQQPNMTSAFGAPSQPTTGAFGAPSQPAVTSPFGAPSQTQAVNPFGAPSQPNPFSQAPAQQQAPSFAPQNPLSQPAIPTNVVAPVFGVPAPAARNPFGAPAQTPSPFGNPSSQPNPFGGARPTQPAPSPFGAPVSNASNNNTGFSRPPNSLPQANGNIGGTGGGASGPVPTNYITKDASGRLLTFKGKRVAYHESEPGFQSSNGSWERIWNPDGPPRSTKDQEANPSKYNETTKQAYEYALQNGRFKDGVMPLLPPKQEWNRWDF